MSLGTVLLYSIDRSRLCKFHAADAARCLQQSVLAAVCLGCYLRHVWVYATCEALRDFVRRLLDYVLVPSRSATNRYASALARDT